MFVGNRRARCWNMDSENKSKITCELLSASNAEHLQPIYTGFHILHEKGVVRLTQRIRKKHTIDDTKAPHLRDVKRSHLRVVLNGDRVMLFDTHDSFEIDSEALRKVDFYFKRSYSDQETKRFNDKHKIFPLGLNCVIYSKGLDVFLIKRISLETGVAKLRTLLLATGLDRLLRGRICELHVNDLGTYPAFNLSPRVLFMAKAWDSKMVSSKEKRDEIDSMNNTRAQCIRLLRQEFGKYFTGGFMHEDYAKVKFRDCLLFDNNLAKRKNYIRLMQRFPICVATSGLHGSNGWKLAEYVSYAKAIVTERLNYRVPGPFVRGANYLDFVSAEGCVEASVKLFHDERLRRKLMMNNYRYYQSHLRPDSLVLNTLAIALSSGESWELQGAIDTNRFNRRLAGEVS